MAVIEEKHLEWALKHLQKYAHSDFYPKLFEFHAISHNWQNVKDYILSLNLSSYCPKSPDIKLALKPNGNFRVVHQLEPIDSLIYTALIHEICEAMEDYRIPKSENIACSYRIDLHLEGSFFSSDTGWGTYFSRSEQLASKHGNGFVIVSDISDFYNQIYTHRVRGLIEEAGKGVYNDKAVIIEKFLLHLNKGTSRSIPVGPAPSIVLAELIMASIDNKIKTYTSDFVQYMDDIRIFFNTYEEAVYMLHELTDYLYSFHRLVFSGEKTKILPVKKFLEYHMRNEEKEEDVVKMAKVDELVAGKLEEVSSSISPYDNGFDYDEAYEIALSQVMEDGQLQVLSDTYYELFEKALSPPRDFLILRHVLRKAGKYRIRNIAPLLLDNFDNILPVIREAIIYLNSVINDDFVLAHREQFERIISAYYMQIPFFNQWIAYLLQNKVFNKINLPSKYNAILSIRDQALIALRRQDTTWVRGFRDSIDQLGPWDRRAVLYSSLILPFDEMKFWVRAVTSSGDIVDQSIFSFLTSQKKSSK